MASPLISHQPNVPKSMVEPDGPKNSTDLAGSLLFSSKEDSTCMDFDNCIVSVSDKDIEVFNDGANYDKLNGTTPENKGNDRIVPCEGKEYKSLEEFEAFAKPEVKEREDVVSFEVSCQCHLFEFKGILCSHILSVFNKKDVEKIPPKYILPRWTKGAGEGIHIPLFKKDGDAIARDLRFNNVISQLRPYLHVGDETFDTIMEALDVTLKKVCVMQEAKEETTITAATEDSVKDEQRPLLGDPHISKTKGRKKESAKESKNGRLKSGFEIGMENSKQLKRRCKECGEIGHYSSTCERRKRAKCVDPVGEKSS